MFQQVKDKLHYDQQIIHVVRQPTPTPEKISAEDLGCCGKAETKCHPQFFECEKLLRQEISITSFHPPNAKTCYNIPILDSPSPPKCLSSSSRSLLLDATEP